MQQEMTLARWLFKPFVRIAGTTSFVVGLGAIGLVAEEVGIRESLFVAPGPGAIVGSLVWKAVPR